jgi:hypothetical protein
MNQQIKTLIEQATTEESDGFKYFDKEKFAQLIVRDVVEQIIIRERNDGEWYQHDIFKHFGVEL